jgi:hypothetical protein
MQLERDRDMDWVHEHLDELREYEGMWVAVVDCRVVAAGDDVDLILSDVEAQGLSNPFVTKIPTARERNTVFIG